MKSVVLCVVAMMLVGCGEDLFEPTISSLTIDPETISLSDTGMTDEFFTVNLSVDNFEDTVTDVTIFRQEPNRVDAVGDVTIDGTTITVRMIAKSWFAGVEPGEYNIGAEVDSPNQSVREFDLATVTVVE